jgi:hypothetical protein
MRANTLVATVVAAISVPGTATAQSGGHAANGSDDQVTVRGKVVGKDLDRNIRLEIFRRLQSTSGI